jgi:selenocysteine-specific elongation factor
VRGDRYILRQASPSQTLGGGRIVDTRPARHRRFRPEVIATLDALARGTPADLLRRALNDQQPHALNQLASQAGIPQELVVEGVEELTVSGDAIQLDAAWVMLTSGWNTLREGLLRAITGYQQRYPLRAGIQREELRSRLKLGVDVLGVVLNTASAAGLVIQQETTVRTPDYVPTPTAEQQRQIRRLLDASRQALYMPPAPDIEPELLAFLIDQGQLVRVAPDITFLPEAYETMLGWVYAQIADPGSVTVAAFRDRFATSRKYALALLEHLDERKITRRAGDMRVRY